MVFKIITWNINGLRSFGGAKEWRQVFADFDQTDLICFQETKISRFSVQEWMACVDDYSSYFSFPSGELLNSGYSGVATYCRESSGARPLTTELSLRTNYGGEIFQYVGNDGRSFIFNDDEEEERFNRQWSNVFAADRPSTVDWKLVDSEGRCVVTKHLLRLGEDLVQKRFLYVINVYCPRNDQTRPERQEYQLRFYHLLEKRAFQLLNESENNFVIMLGDFNTAHTSFDVYDDAEFCYSNSKSRKWITKLLSTTTTTTTSNPKRKFIDAFRVPTTTTAGDIPNQKLFTCWNTMLGCRITNYGSRIDYILIDSGLLPYLSKCYPLTDYFGSDHCPVVAEFNNLDSFGSSACFVNQHSFDSKQFSQNCTQLWPEFSNKNSIRKYFTSNRNDQINQKDTSQVNVSSINPVAAVVEIQSPKRPKIDDNRKSSNKQQTSVLNFFQSYQMVTNRSKLSNVSTNVPNETKPKIEVKNVEKGSNDEDDEDQIQEISLSQVSQSSLELSQPSTSANSVDQWKRLFCLESAPLCNGHRLPCVRRTVKKDGPKKGRKFYSCPKQSIGPPDHPESRCNFFQWLKK